jgi:hypothetical protein
MNRGKLERSETPLEKYVVRNKFDDYIILSSGGSVLKVTTTVGRPLRLRMYLFEYEYPTDNELVDPHTIKRISKFNK